MKSKFNVGKNPIIPFIEGDGIGRDISPVTMKVVDAAVKAAYGDHRKITWLPLEAGLTSFEKTGNWLPQEVLDAIQEHKIGIKGPLTTPTGGNQRSLNVALRKTFDLYACVRPVKYFNNVPSPMKRPDNVNLTIFRENTEDCYSGIEVMPGSRQAYGFYGFAQTALGITIPQDSGITFKVISETGSKRIARAAIQYAIAHKLPSITVMHKGNIMKATEAKFLEWIYDVAADEFSMQTFTMATYEHIAKENGKDAADRALHAHQQAGNIIIKSLIADDCFQQIILNPQYHSLILTTNLNGDYLSDAAAALVGGLGVAPGCNINYETGYAIFEATHGTAASIAGTGKANPTSLILSAKMMLEYMGWDEAAELIGLAVADALQHQSFTSDLYDKLEDEEKATAILLSTVEYGNMLCATIAKKAALV